MDKNEINSIASRLTIQKVKLDDIMPELDGKIFVKVMTAKERNEYNSSIMTIEEDEDGEIRVKPNAENREAKLAVRIICDEAGNRLFEDKEIDKLSAWNSILMDRVFEAGSELNKMDIKSLEKNSNSVPTE